MSELALAGNRVTVTGAAGGLGRTFALGFAKAGARLLIADVNAQGLGETERLVAETGAEVLAVEVDVTSGSSCRNLAEIAREKLGGMGTLVKMINEMIGICFSWLAPSSSGSPLCSGQPSQN